MSQQQPTSSASPTTPLGRALDQNEMVQDTVAQSADELLVINTVLKKKIPEHVQTDDLAKALEKGSELEGRIQESAENLAQVNELLGQEIAERADLERELAVTKAALANVKDQRAEQ